MPTLATLRFLKNCNLYLRKQKKFFVICSECSLVSLCFGGFKATSLKSNKYGEIIVMVYFFVKHNRGI